MDSSFVWILMFAGAAVALLGLFLVASERELKSKRREIEELHTKLERSDGERHGGQTLEQANRVLDQNDPGSRDREEQADARAKLETEILALRRTLDAGQARIRELEAAQAQPDHQATDIEHQREQQRLNERLAELEAGRLADQEKLAELQSVRARLAEAESIQLSLKDELRLREADIPVWQARLAAAEQQAQRVAALERPCHELLAQQAALAEAQRRLREELAGFARLIENAGQTPESFGVASSPNLTSPDGNGAQETQDRAASDADRDDTASPETKTT
jgi:hypothetical protein